MSKSPRSEIIMLITVSAGFHCHHLLTSSRLFHCVDEPISPESACEAAGQCLALARITHPPMLQASSTFKAVYQLPASAGFMLQL